MLRSALLETPVPAAREAEEHAWDVVDAAYRRRGTAPARAPRPRLALAIVAVLALLALLALTPAGAKVRDWIHDAIEPGEGARPSLTSLPAPGRLLVESPRGAWVVNEDGSKRLLGAYDQATWSPQGLYVAATDQHDLVAVDPVGTVHWSLPQKKPISEPAWAPSGFRVAYLAGRQLHVVAGDGTGDTLLDQRVAAAPPAWKPDTQPPETEPNVLAYVDADHRVRVVDVDTGRQLWRSTPIGGPIESIDWSADGRDLIVLSSVYFVVLGPDGESITKGAVGSANGGGTAEAVAVSPAGDKIALARRTLTGTSEVVLFTLHDGLLTDHRLLAKPGVFTDLAWSPDGAWLLVPWRDADTWLFSRPADRKVIAYADISRQFAPGSSGPVAFPHPAGWCCAAPP
jgi:WD40 repeat protein